MKYSKEEKTKRSIYDIVNGSVIAILIFSFTLSLGLFSVWLYWMNAEQENLTDSLLQQKVSSYMHDIVTVSSLNPENVDQQLSLILKEFPLHCYHIETQNGLKTGLTPCERDSSPKIIRLESGGLDVGTLAYDIKVRISAETYIFIITNFLIFFMATTAIWLVLLRNIKNNILNPLNRIANSIDLEGRDIDSEDEVQEISTLRERILSHTESLKDHVKYEAIAKTTQMLAHDVRKPFTMLKSILDVLDDAPTRDIKSLLKQFSPDVNRALAEVNGLISDIIEIDSKKESELVSKSPVGLVYKTLSETIQFKLVSDIHSYRDLEFHSEWGHQHQAKVDSTKVSRILSNIIANAIHAAGDVGKIWFRTSEQQDFIKFTIGNLGSLISSEDGKHLFDAFFTKGKANGTGLGLAIAKKLVTEHGGEIWYTSSSEVGTEFHFTLPASNLEDTCKMPLPRRISEFQAINPMPNSSVVTDETSSFSEVGSLIKQGDLRQTRLLVCDDEELYLKTISRHISQDRELKNKVDFITASDIANCEKFLAERPVDVCILDVDLGSDIGGFELSQRIRQKYPNMFICIHSNRDGELYADKALQYGADLYLPKPMQRRCLHNIITISEARKFGEQLLVVVDDSLLVLESWKRFFGDKRLVSMQSPEEFWRLFNAKSTLKLDVIGNLVTDVNFGSQSRTSGIEFANLIREKGYQRNIYFASDAELPPDLMLRSSGYVISKIPSKARGDLF